MRREHDTLPRPAWLDFKRFAGGCPGRFRRPLGRVCACAVLAAIAVGSVQAAPPNRWQAKKEKTAAKTPSSIAIKRVEPVDVVFIEHEGPYWSVGAVVERVASYQRTHHLQGRLFIRYLDDPSHVRPKDLRSQIGIILSEPCDHDSPLKTDRWPAMRVAHQIVEQPRVSTRRHLAAIRRWAKAQGQPVTAESIEIYSAPSTTSRVAGAGLRGVEIQVILEIQEPEEDAAQAEAASPAPRENGGAGDRVRIRLPRRITAERRRGAPLDRAKPQPQRVDAPMDDLDRTPKDEPAAEVSTSEQVEVAATPPEQRAQEKPLETELTQEASPAAEPDQLDTEPAVSTPDELDRPKPAIELAPSEQITEPHAEEDVTDTANVRPVAPSIAALIRVGDYETVAQRVLPDGPIVSQSREIWLGQVVFRVNAVAKGLERGHPDEASFATELAEALTARYRARQQTSAVDPLDQPVIRVDVHRDPDAKRKRELMRGLDRLLGRLAIRAATPDDAFAGLAGTLQEVSELVASQSDTNATGPEE